MASEVVMPQMGESIFEGTITKWLKKVGDAVHKDEPLFEISTDKVDAEIPSPVAGVLTEIKVPEGATVQINTVVALVGAGGEGAATAPVGQEAAGDGATAAMDAAAAAELHGKSSKGGANQEAAPAEQVEQLSVDEVGVTAGASGGTEVVMPQMGESIFEGTITKWLKKLGDTVQKEEPLFEISTDKVDAEIPSPVTGVLTEMRSAEGATVQINTVVAVIGGAVGKSAPQAAAVAVPEAKAAVAEARPSVSAGTATTGRIRSSPLVRRIAKDHQLDLAKIAGTGGGGRITRDDALKFMAANGAGSGAAGTTAAVVKTGAGTAAGAGSPVAPAAALLPGSLVPMTKMRTIIAQRMVASAQTSPHVHTVFRVDMTRIVRIREREKSKYEQRNGVKLTYMPFIAAAVVETLRKFPIVNASLEGEAIRYHANINLGIAVALEWGLIVPVIQHAEERSFLGLARAVADLAERARGKKLKPEEVGGGTFTLTNSGIFGEEFGTPIINQPETAILAIGGLKKEAVVLTDAEGNDTIAIRSMQHFCLGFDHRSIDGADAGRFMAEFKKGLEEWSGEIG